MVGDFTSLSALQPAGLKSLSMKSLYVSDIETSDRRWHGNCHCVHIHKHKYFIKTKKQGRGELKRGLFTDEEDTCR